MRNIIGADTSDERMVTMMPITEEHTASDAQLRAAVDEIYRRFGRDLSAFFRQVPEPRNHQEVKEVQLPLPLDLEQD